MHSANKLCRCICLSRWQRSISIWATDKMARSFVGFVWFRRHHHKPNNVHSQWSGDTLRWARTSHSRMFCGISQYWKCTMHFVLHFITLQWIKMINTRHLLRSTGCGASGIPISILLSTHWLIAKFKPFKCNESNAECICCTYLWISDRGLVDEYLVMGNGECPSAERKNNNDVVTQINRSEPIRSQRRSRRQMNAAHFALHSFFVTLIAYYARGARSMRRQHTIASIAPIESSTERENEERTIWVSSLLLARARARALLQLLLGVSALPAFSQTHKHISRTVARCRCLISFRFLLPSRAYSS